MGFPDGLGPVLKCTHKSWRVGVVSASCAEAAISHRYPIHCWLRTLNTTLVFILSREENKSLYLEKDFSEKSLSLETELT